MLKSIRIRRYHKISDSENAPASSGAFSFLMLDYLPGRGSHYVPDFFTSFPSWRQIRSSDFRLAGVGPPPMHGDERPSPPAS
jgi:hypothetical protein